jgi:hypothetical protein
MDGDTAGASSFAYRGRGDNIGLAVGRIVHANVAGLPQGRDVIDIDT